MTDLVIPYVPRDVFLPYHANSKRFAVTLAHRRAGKTVARVNKLIRKAIELPRSQPFGRFAFLDPYRNQAKRNAWEYLKWYARPLLEMGGKVNESELEVTMPHNQARITLYGADNPVALRGPYLDGIAVDEAQDIGLSVMNTVIMPQLTDFQGWLDVSGSGHGWDNVLGNFVKTARKYPDQWFLQILKASETGLLPEEELTTFRNLMSPDQYRQEFECDLDAAITGAVYGETMQLAGFVKNLEVAAAPVHTAWDLGYRDATAIWWFQVISGEIRLLKYHEDNFKGIPHYCDFLKEQPYNYGEHYVPWDATFKLQAANGRSIAEQAFREGIKMIPIPETSAANYIEAVRTMLPRCWFDEDNCEDGISALKQYQFEWNEGRKAFMDTPKHDWTSHAARAFDIIARVWQEPRQPEKPKEPRWLHEATAAEVFALDKIREKSERI